MRLALDQAHNAWLSGEVPVGAVILRQGQLIATGYNRPITTHDPDRARRDRGAAPRGHQLLGNYRLPECELFVTLEPCAMCAMALMHARFSRIVFAAPDPKTGAAGSVVNLFAQPLLNHHTQVAGRRCWPTRRASCCATFSPSGVSRRASAGWRGVASFPWARPWSFPMQTPPEPDRL